MTDTEWRIVYRNPSLENGPDRLHIVDDNLLTQTIVSVDSDDMLRPEPVHLSVPLADVRHLIELHDKHSGSDG